MNKSRPEGIEVNSDQIDGRLACIEDRIGGIESILAHVNRNEIEALIKRAVANSEKRKQILKLCETPKSILELQQALELNSPQAVNNHLAPLRDFGLLHHATTAPQITYKWSPLIRRLSKAVRKDLFG